MQPAFAVGFPQCGTYGHDTRPMSNPNAAKRIASCHTEPGRDPRQGCQQPNPCPTACSDSCRQGKARQEPPQGLAGSPGKAAPRAASGAALCQAAPLGSHGQERKALSWRLPRAELPTTAVCQGGRLISARWAGVSSRSTLRGHKPLGSARREEQAATAQLNLGKTAVLTAVNRQNRVQEQQTCSSDMDQQNTSGRNRVGYSKE